MSFSWSQPPTSIAPAGRVHGMVRLSGIAVALVLASTGVGSATETMTLVSDPASGFTMEIEGWAGISSPVDGRDAGLLPLTLVVSNNGDVADLWTISPGRSYSRSTGAQPTASLLVPAKGSARSTVYVDVTSAGYGIYVDFRLSKPGSHRDFSIASSAVATGGTSAVPLPTAVSQGVSAARGDAFSAYLITGGGLDMSRPPEDWRGWTTFRSVLMTEGEWLAMPAAARAAAVGWAALGGRLGVLVADVSDDRLDRLRLPRSHPDGRRRVGAGEVVTIPWNGTVLTAADTQAFLEGRTVSDFSRMLGEYRAGPPTGAAVTSGIRDRGYGGWHAGFGNLVAAFGPRSLPVAPILGFLAVFGLVAGPLNLMLLAGPGRRSRMFWTTPAISVVATLFLLGLMFFRDGAGGAGIRRVLALLVPEHNSLALIQEQFSRTGVLFGGSFPVREPSWMRPLGGPPSDGGVFDEVDGRLRRGDWFRSRSDQAFLLEAVRPSRARIEFIPGRDAATPAVISSIDVPLERVFVIDDAGKVWSVGTLGTGERKPLQASTVEEFAQWFDGRFDDAGPVRRTAADSVRSLRGWAYAESSEAAKVAVQTHPAIRWRNEEVTFAGPYVEAPAP